MKLYPAEARGITELDWLKSYHSFSFGDYIDPENKGFGNLRVINDDYLPGGAGFETHPHWRVEIITYVVEGALEHKDSAGNHYVIHAGDFQRISAGTGIEHSEFNYSKQDGVRFLQIWIKTLVRDSEPEYMQQSILPESKLNKFKLVASETGREDSIHIKQNCDLSVALLDPARELEYRMINDKAWVQIVTGEFDVNGQKLIQGDGLAIDFRTVITIKNASVEQAELLLFDMV